MSYVNQKHISYQTVMNTNDKKKSFIIFVFILEQVTSTNEFGQLNQNPHSSETLLLDSNALLFHGIFLIAH